MYITINNQLKQAMVNKDIDFINFLRTIKSRLTEYLVKKNIPRDGDISNDVVILVIKSYKNSLKGAIEDLSSDTKKANSLITQYSKEIEYCNKYLPKEDYSGLEVIVKEVIKKFNITDEKQVGKAIGFILKSNPDFNGKVIKEHILKEIKG